MRISILITDCHNHVIPEAALRLLASDRSFGVRVATAHFEVSPYGEIALQKSSFDPSAKLAELKAKSIERAVVSFGPSLYLYEVEGSRAEEFCRVVNQGLAEFCSDSANSLYWMAHVPLQDPRRATTILRDARTLGCVGVEVGTIVNGKRLDQSDYDHFWSSVERLGLAVFVHPGRGPEYSGTGDFFMRNIVGHQLETTIMIERLLCAGVLDRHPALRLLLAHGGGYFPIQAGRLAHARQAGVRGLNFRRQPQAYAGQILTDTITHDSQALRYIAGWMNVSNIAFGTDLPTPMGPADPVQDLTDAVGVADAQEIMVDVPRRLFSLPS